VLFGEPAPLAAVVARGEGATIDCAGLLKALTTEFGGKGGGRPDLAQGGGLEARPGDLRARARTLLGKPTGPPAA
jgi:alanyl-tRNA synthetase